jgi:hypothetical protein
MLRRILMLKEALVCFAVVTPSLYNRIFGAFLQLRPYLPENTGSRSISKVKLVRAPLILQFVRMWEHRGVVVFWNYTCVTLRLIFLKRYFNGELHFFPSDPRRFRPCLHESRLQNLNTC